MFRNPHTPLTEDQKLLRKQVAHQVTEHPETFDMSNWWWSDACCGTTGCLAGWAVHLSGTVPVSEALLGLGIERLAIELLGLTYGEYMGDSGGPPFTGGCTLFYTSNADAARRIQALAEAS